VEEPACKPDSVPAPRRRTGSAGWRPSLWGPRRRGPRAAYPGASGGPPAPCLALLRMGFAEPAGHPAAGELLPHRFTLAPAPNRRRRAGPGRWAVVLCGTFRGSPRLGVTQHPALWSPDFPRRELSLAPRPPGRLLQQSSIEGRRARSSGQPPLRARSLFRKFRTSEPVPAASTSNPPTITRGPRGKPRPARPAAPLSPAPPAA